jgi:hypothetical protein
VEGHVENLEADSSHVFLAENSFFGGPLEGGDTRVLNFIEVLDSLGGVVENVGAGGIGTEGPDLSGLIGVPFVLLGEDLGSDFGVVLGADGSIVDFGRKLFLHGSGAHVETVVLVGGFREASLGRFGLNSFTIRNDGVGGSEFDSRKFFGKILQADFKMELSGTGDDVFTTFFGVALHARIGLGEALETFDEFGQVRRILGLDGNTDDRGNAEFHDADVVSGFGGSDGSGFHQKLIDTDETDGVTARAVFNGFNITSHHEDGSLNVLDEKIILLSRNIVGAHDADLLASSNDTREDTTKSIETTLVGSGDHLRDVHHERTVGVTISDGSSALVILRSFVKIFDSVLLGFDGRRKVKDNHFEEGVGSGEEFLHDDLQEGLLDEFLLFGGQNDLEGRKHLLVGILFVVHDGFEEFEDGVQDELAESARNQFARGGLVLFDPLLGFGIEEVLTPKFLHKLVTGDTEFGGVETSEFVEGESPSVKTTSEGNSTLGGIALNISEKFVMESGNNNVHGLDRSGESLVGFFGSKFEFEQNAIHLVDHEDGTNSLSEGLSEHGLGLDTNTFDAIDDDEGAVGHTKGGSNFRRKINVSGGIDQVNQIGGGGLAFLGRHLIVHGNAGGFDGDASVLFVLTGVSETSFSGFGVGNNTSFADQGIGQG